MRLCCSQTPEDRFSRVEARIYCILDGALFILNKDMSVKQRINLKDDPISDINSGITYHQPYQVAMLGNRINVVSVPSAKVL